MPIDQIGISGKICDMLNAIISPNQKMVQEFTRAGNTIGKQGKLTFEESDLNLLVNDVLMDMEATVKEKNAKILIDALPSLYINPSLMRPLFYNLIHNALRYAKSNVDPHLRIFAESDSGAHGVNNKGQSRNYCRIYVEDNGIGFDQKYADQIFEMFKRLHHHDEYEGTGIGLAFCKKIVEQHEGFITAKSALEKGSTFIVSLPIRTMPLPATGKTVAFRCDCPSQS